MGVNFQNTSESEGFDIFEKLKEEKISCGGNNNLLNIYILKIHDRRFCYDRMYDYILDNICQYVFSRRRNLEVDNNKKSNRKLILQALDHLRSPSNKDPGAGGELGEILLYLFLEQDLQAPKLLSKVELKTNENDYVKGADAIHFKFRTRENGDKILQLVIGEAKIMNDLKKGIEEAFSSINDHISNNCQDIRLIDAHLMNQWVDDEEAKLLKKYLLGDEVEEKETVFGIFLGYTINYNGEKDNNDNYKVNVKNENVNQVLQYMEKIIEEIRKYKISNYQFNFYFLPFLDAKRDRRIIMENLVNKKSVFIWRDIKNG